MNFISRKKIFILSVTASMMIMGSTVFAGSSWSSQESKSLPGWNGSAYSSTQTKAAIGQAGLQMDATEGYEIDVRTEGTSGTSNGVNGSWTRDVKGGNTYQLSAPQGVGDNLRLHFSSNLLTTKSTNIVYKWRSN
ncbi:hypothetical protein [Paenibacillus physcomitrellae]|uniref:Uncharacterized protein n=1 Tax=Paenibacillus physcomitrellae TaxID=1619311 RepID=A0ABQ1FZP2_9BACL|nr:hypothetical protein [Paenibacillus physcomitrellae]GGA33536.1 hypothetical protein GCM10010917_18400 [Paenibacillus physcomitrellae]